MGEVGIESQALREQWRERIRWRGILGPLPPWLGLLLYGASMVPGPGFFETPWDRARAVLARQRGQTIRLAPDLRMHELAEKDLNEQLAPFGVRVARDADGKRPYLGGPDAAITFEMSDKPQRDPLPDQVWFSPFDEPIR